MCLDLAVRYPEAVVESGVLHGHEYHIIHNGRGYLCGYVKVTPGHEWYGKSYHNIDVDVHGGLTFEEKDIPCDKGGPDDGHWFGFDCAHGGDLPDEQYMDVECKGWYRGPLSEWEEANGRVRDVNYVRSECDKLALAAAGSVVLK